MVRRAPGTRAPSKSESPIAGYSDGRLPDALEILAVQMRKAIAERRAAPAGSEQHRRADELVADLNELYFRLQRRMEVPAEIWLLEHPGLRSGRVHRVEARGRQLSGHPSFSYSRAIQDPVLEAWRGRAANVPAAQDAFARRAQLNGLARMGQYQPEATS